MRDDDIISCFNEIEEKVEIIISQNKSIQKENAELRMLNEQFERELDNRDEEKKRYEEEQSIIRSKLDKLTQRLSSIIE